MTKIVSCRHGGEQQKVHFNNPAAPKNNAKHGNHRTLPDTRDAVYKQLGGICNCTVHALSVFKNEGGDHCQPKEKKEDGMTPHFRPHRDANGLAAFFVSVSTGPSEVTYWRDDGCVNSHPTLTKKNPPFISHTTQKTLPKKKQREKNEGVRSPIPNRDQHRSHDGNTLGQQGTKPERPCSRELG
jgi:hypothetical protein